MSLWISDSNISPPAWISSAGIWSLSGDLYFFNFAIAIPLLNDHSPTEDKTHDVNIIFSNTPQIITNLKLIVQNNFNCEYVKQIQIHDKLQ
jgi:hypothetical protein